MLKSFAQFFFSLLLTPICISAFLEFVLGRCDPKGCGIFTAVTVWLVIVPSLFSTLGFFLRSYKVVRSGLDNSNATSLNFIGALSAVPLAAWLIICAETRPFYDQSEIFAMLLLLILGPLLIGNIIGWLYCKKIFSSEAESVPYRHTL